MSVRRTELEFGIAVASEAVPNAECVSLGLYFPTGSRHETRETNGSAHFIEHLIFKGTRRRSSEAVNREIDCLGQRLQRSCQPPATADTIVSSSPSWTEALNPPLKRMSSSFR